MHEHFTTQIDTDILAAVLQLAQSEGTQVQTLVDEALHDLIEKRKHAAPRLHVMEAYNSSHAAYAPLYQNLAK